MNGERLYYVVKTDGKISSPLFESHAGAVEYKLRLPKQKQNEAEIVRVTKEGKQLLLG